MSVLALAFVCLGSSSCDRRRSQSTEANNADRAAAVSTPRVGGLQSYADAVERVLPAVLTICIADADDGSGTGVCDGGVTIDDLLFYLGLFEAGNIRADVDDGSGSGTPDGGVTIDDLLYFLARFEAGC